MVPVCRHASNWRTYAAVGGLVFGLIAWCAVSAADPERSSAADNPAGETTRKPLYSAPNHETPGTLVYPEQYSIYSYSCEHPQNAEQESLCIERQAALATADGARWARYTVLVGIAGTFAVVLTHRPCGHFVFPVSP
jgi:hypothetical protein